MTEPELVPEAEAFRASAHDADVAAEQRLVPKVKRKSNLRWVIEIAITLSVLVGMFVVILPRITGSSYEEVWKVLGAIEPWELLLLVAVWIGNLWTYTPVITNSLPGSPTRRPSPPTWRPARSRTSCPSAEPSAWARPT